MTSRFLTVVFLLQKKQLAALKGPKVEGVPAPIPIVKKSVNEGPKADPKEVAKKLLKSGAIAAIKAPPSNATTGFKRKRTGDRPIDRPPPFRPFSSGPTENDEEGDSKPPLAPGTEVTFDTLRSLFGTFDIFEVTFWYF